MGIWDANFFQLDVFYGDIAEAGLIDRAMTDDEFSALLNCSAVATTFRSSHHKEGFVP
jgi:hypothetical protein